MRLFRGDIIFSKTLGKFEILKEGYIAEKNGQIVDVGYNLLEQYPHATLVDYSGKLLIPSFVDLHTHAVQYGNLGLGLEEELLSWLENYTFKEEQKFSNLSYAHSIFEPLLDDIVEHGTTRVVFFSSIHEEATKLLIELSIKKGIGAYVGKVNMDRNAPKELLEETQNSIEITKRFLDRGENHVSSIITPRFAPSCSDGLMKKLGELGKNLPIQTHLCENKEEIAWVRELFPYAKNYLDVYLKYNLISSKTILAHCVYCTPQEQNQIAKKGAFVAHCPSANINLTSGIMDIKSYIEQGISVGLGTDVGAGDTLSIKDTIVNAIWMSKINHIVNREKKVLTLSEAFYLATKGGGAYFGKVGSFEIGYELDMLVIEMDELSQKRDLNILEKLQRFIYTKNSNMIKERYCRGERLLHESPHLT